MQKTKTKINQSNFGLITVSAELNALMEREPQYQIEVFGALQNKYFFGDWGHILEDSVKYNNETIKQCNGGDILAAYRLSNGKEIWIKTYGFGLTAEQCKPHNISDCNNTCIMYPHEN